MTLSDKIRKWNQDPIEEHLLLEDVKDFISKLKEYKQHDVHRNKVVIVIDEEDLDKLAGDKLI